MSRFLLAGPGRSLVALMLAAILAAPCRGAAPTSAPDERLAHARELVDSGRIDEARAVLDQLLERRAGDAGALLLRSTVRFMEGDVEGGRRDLELSLELDPAQRQAWLNRAALDISEKRLDDAIEALLEARDLDPGAADTELNLGAVFVLKGDLDAASGHFERYLERSGDSAEAWFLVSSNFAMGGYADRATRHLRRAIEIDERVRMAARTDANFEGLAADPGFQAILRIDGYRPPPGAHYAQRSFEAVYDGGKGPLLQAVLNALQLSGRPFDSRIEVTPDWSLVWSDFRIKIRVDGPKAATIELTAPAERFSPADWRRQAEAFLQEITLQLVRLNRPY